MADGKASLPPTSGGCSCAPSEGDGGASRSAGGAAVRAGDPGAYDRPIVDRDDDDRGSPSHPEADESLGTPRRTGVLLGPSRFTMLRETIWITFEDPSSSTIARSISSAMIVVIIVSIVNFAVGTFDVGMCKWQPAFVLGEGDFVCAGTRIEEGAYTQWIENICIFIFSGEYVLRLLCCSVALPVWRFIIDPLNVLDVLAVMPWYVTRIVKAVVDGEDTDNVQKMLGVLRIVRLTRILRVFKASKSMKMMLVLGKTMQRSTAILAVLLFSCICMMILFGAMVMVFEQGVYNPHLQQYIRSSGAPSPFYSMFNSMYWCMTTMTTVGYGDYFPENGLGYITGIMAALMGIVVLSLPITVIGVTFAEEYDEQSRITRRERRLASLLKPVAPAPPLSDYARRLPYIGPAVGRVLPRRKAVEVEVSAPMPRRSTRDTEYEIKDLAEAMEVPGFVQCAWLLSDFRQQVRDQIQAQVRKGEVDLARMSRQVMIHSRVVATAVTSSRPSVEAVERSELDPAALDSGSESTKWQRGRAEVPSAAAETSAPPSPPSEGHSSQANPLNRLPSE